MPVASCVTSGVNAAHCRASQSSPAAWAVTRRRIHEVLAEQHLQDRQQQEGVTVGDDAQPLELRRGLSAPGIDDDDPATPAHDVVHAVLDAWQGEHAAVRHHRVGSDHDQQVRARNVGTGNDVGAP